MYLILIAVSASLIRSCLFLLCHVVLWSEADRLFFALDSNKSGRISFDDFIVGLAVCCRGTLEEKMRFIFGVYDMDGVSACCC